MRDRLLESPALKTAVFVICTVLAGVLASSFVAEISAPETLQWSLFYRSWSFYGLLALAVIIYVYNRAAYQYENEVRRFVDTKYCEAYMRRELLPEMAERCKKRIREGSGAELKEAMTELRRFLKRKYSRQADS